MELYIINTNLFLSRVAGVVDEDYRGNLAVVLFNFSDDQFDVKRGDRIAQFICQKIEYPELEECEVSPGTANAVSLLSNLLESFVCKYIVYFP